MWVDTVHNRKSAPTDGLGDANGLRNNKQDPGGQDKQNFSIGYILPFAMELHFHKGESYR